MSATTRTDDHDDRETPPEEMSNDELLEYIADTDTPLGERVSRMLRAERDQCDGDQGDCS